MILPDDLPLHEIIAAFNSTFVCESFVFNEGKWQPNSKYVKKIDEAIIGVISQLSNSLKSVQSDLKSYRIKYNKAIKATKEKIKMDEAFPVQVESSILGHLRSSM